MIARLAKTPSTTNVTHKLILSAIFIIPSIALGLLIEKGAFDSNENTYLKEGDTSFASNGAGH
jgi:hypothetical protein